MGIDRGIELIVGPMFCGKTEELMRRLRRYEIAKRKIQVFKPDLDDRYGEDDLSTHSGLRMPGIPVKNIDELTSNLKNGTEIIGIDEIQFFDDKIIDFALGNQRKYLLIFAGLSLDFEGELFRFKNSKKHIGDLMPYTNVTSLNAICTHDCEDGTICGGAANYSQRLIDDSQLIVVGGLESYGARCYEHFVKPTRNPLQSKG